MLTAADLRFDPVAHRTTTPDGADVPHVTTVLGATGLATDFEALAAISATLADDVAWARARGTAVHADCHAYDDGELDVAAMHADVAPYVQAWATARRNLRLVPVSRERFLYNPIHRYAGITDGVFEQDNAPSLRRPRILVDLKTGDPNDGAAHLQTAAYEQAYAFCGGGTIDERWAIWLQPDARVPYRVVNYSAPERWQAAYDFQVFLSALCVYNNQPGRRPRIA